VRFAHRDLRRFSSAQRPPARRRRRSLASKAAWRESMNLDRGRALLAAAGLQPTLVYAWADWPLCEKLSDKVTGSLTL